MIKLTDEYFEDEIREGFYVPAAMKQAWGAEIEVLNEIDRVCKKHGIVYSACWGTLLGAVRHSSIIPWDDDFDIMMRRSDFNKFASVWKEELPEGFDLISFKTHEYHIYFRPNVVGKSRACFEKEHLERFHGFPYVCGIDIFIIDNISRDEEAEKNRMKVIDYIITVADKIFEGEIKGKEVEEHLRKIERVCRIQIPRSIKGVDLRIYLYTIAEDNMASISDSDSDKMTQIMPWGITGRDYFFTRHELGDTIEIPFETGTIPVVANYQNMARKSYGDYIQIYKDVAGHDYPFFEKQKEDLQKLLDFEIPGFKFDKKMIMPRENSDKGNTYKVICTEVAEELKNMCIGIENCDDANIAELLGDIQQAAIELGTFIENTKGEGYITVSRLEELCECLFRYNEAENAESRKVILNRILELVEEVKNDILSRKEIIFIPFKAKYWSSLDEVYRKNIADVNADVYVAPVAYYYKNYDGTLRDKQINVEDYPKELNLNIIDFETYDFALRRPDVIYIQNPYDEYNESISVEPAAYSNRLKQYTDNLVYIPWFKTDEFEKDDARAYKNMKYYCCMPGVINADKVIVQSEHIRELYIDKLCEFAGNDTRDVWEQKILALVNEEEAETKRKQEAKLLYVPDFSIMLEHSDIAAKKISDVLEIMKNAVAENNLQVIWHEQPAIKEHMKGHNAELYEEYKLVRDRFINEGGIVFDSYDMNDKENRESYSEHAYNLAKMCDAFYGDPGVFVHLFRHENKPVMIQNYLI